MIFLAAILTAVTNVEAQKSVDTQHLLWSRYVLRVGVGENYHVRQEFEERTYWFPWRQHQFVSRTMVVRKLGKGWSAGGGMAYFIQSFPQDPYEPTTENVQELRPQIELGYRQEVSDKFSINHRYWSELRFFELPGGKFSYANNRTRYRLEINYAIGNKTTIKAFDEIFFNIGGKIVNNVFDQNRYGASINYSLMEHIDLELGYLNWFQQRPSGQDFYNRHIIRFTFYHNIQLKS